MKKLLMYYTIGFLLGTLFGIRANAAVPSKIGIPNSTRGAVLIFRPALIKGYKTTLAYKGCYINGNYAFNGERLTFKDEENGRWVRTTMPYIIVHGVGCDYKGD
jgi:hypothetical protein